MFLFFLPSLWEGPGMGLVSAQECNIIYIAPNGASSGAAGTSINPANLSYGLSMVSSANNKLWLAVGNYTMSSTFTMISNITLEGGFDPITWIKSNSLQTIIFRDNSNILTNPNRLVAIDCNNISNFNIHDITFNVSSAVGNGVSTYGIHIANCSGYSITRVTVNVGDATNGPNGTPGTAGVNGAQGAAGQNGDENGGCCNLGGNGASGSFAGSNAGGKGGNGGQRGTCTNFSGTGTAYPGQNGLAGSGTPSVSGGFGGQGNCNWISITDCNLSPNTFGTPGQIGADGSLGAQGAVGIPAFLTWYINGDGQQGQNGANGSGGGGGGGGGSQGCLICGLFIPDLNGTGAGGGGGGEGGQGGIGALGGTGGGSSFGIYVYANGANTFIKDATITPGLQGIGGNGGSPGGNGGLGGLGGPRGQSPTCDDIGWGGKGGNGGNGGIGGDGGNGAPGVSFPVYEDPAGIAVAQSDMKSIVEPQIFVKNKSCSWSDVTYYTNASGLIQWYFDGGSIPLTAVGDSATVQYSIPGRHSITLVIDGLPYMFTDFTGTFTDGLPYSPDIVGPDSICPGATANFSATFPSAFTVLSYNWKVFPFESQTLLSSGTNPSFSFVFTQTGNYIVTLQTESQCCGKSKIDTFKVNVLPTQVPNVFVTASTTTVCLGKSVSFGAQPVNGGNAPTYLWFLNGVSTGVSGNSFISSNLSNQDSVTCQMVSSYTCPLPNPVISQPITITVYPLPTVVCTASPLFLGYNTGLTAIPAGGTSPFSYNWDFGDGGAATGDITQHAYGGTGNYNYSVTITDANGCTGVCNNSLTIVLPPLIYANFTTIGVTVACGTTTVNFTDLTTGGAITWNWNFGDGFGDTIQNPLHYYTVPGSYSVTLIAGNGFFYDTITYPNIIVVKTQPQADIINQQNKFCFSVPSQFFDNSSNAASWLWNFGNGDSSQLQNPFYVYADTGFFNVTLTVMSADSCVSMDTTSVQVFPQPVAGFLTDTSVICQYSTVTFTDTSLGNVAKWKWDFGDGFGDTIKNTSHTYLNAGTYPILLIVTSPDSCSTAAIGSVKVLQKAQIKFGLSDTTVCLNQNIFFTDSSVNANNLVWNFGDNDSSTLFSVSHLYADTGVYNVLLTVYSPDGCVSNDSTKAMVLPKPKAKFSPSDTVICQFENVSFSDKSVDPYKWKWDFGNGSVDSVANPVYTYTIPGKYSVTEIVTNALGCNDTVKFQNLIEVKTMPDANFITDTPIVTFPDNDFVLTNLSTNYMTWVWDLGNGTKDSVNFNTKVEYPDTGLYSIILHVLYDNFCIDTMHREVRVLETETFFIPNAFTPNNDGVNDEFAVLGKSITDFRMYIFDRWGELIFETNNLNKPWNGKLSDGSVSMPGVYPYRIDYKLQSSKSRQLTKIGSVTLVR